MKLQIPIRIQSFILSILLNQTLPLIPLVIELFYKKTILQSSLVLTASIYSFTLGIVSINQMYFGFSILVGLLSGCYYGSVLQTDNALPLQSNLSFWLIALMFLLHTIERFDRHINNREPFFLFNTKEDL
ncbi:hypothetical protein JWG44_07615 [Leptospira sp. 201903071]|uniref:hypothetical protein n=1 Tax=Leptospira ainazelensis TaxID=2810034 RepID=UPI0019668424|nr:hypothetical protein [Leptospira ainazelensis]MBM9500115.1 hypothetical protein [Leptospira ainazelensis]